MSSQEIKDPALRKIVDTIDSSIEELDRIIEALRASGTVSEDPDCECEREKK